MREFVADGEISRAQKAVTRKRTQLDEEAALETLAHLQELQAVEVELDPDAALAAEEAAAKGEE